MEGGGGGGVHSCVIVNACFSIHLIHVGLHPWLWLGCELLLLISIGVCIGVDYSVGYRFLLGILVGKILLTPLIILGLGLISNSNVH